LKKDQITSSSSNNNSKVIGFSQSTSNSPIIELSNLNSPNLQFMDQQFNNEQQQQQQSSSQTFSPNPYSLFNFNQPIQPKTNINNNNNNNNNIKRPHEEINTDNIQNKKKLLQMNNNFVDPYSFTPPPSSLLSPSIMGTLSPFNSMFSPPQKISTKESPKEK